MRSSILPPRLTSRVCAFCRQQQQQQQQQQRVATTRNLHASSATQQHRVPGLPRTARSQSRLLLPHAPTSVTRRSFASDARVVQSSQPDTDADVDVAAPKPGPKVAVAVPPQTHYEFFPKTLGDGPPPRGRFRIDVRALRREFLGLQAGAHPDVHPAHLRARAQATSARINEAFRTLESPLLRAQYILSLRRRRRRGFDEEDEEERAKVEDPELLMLVLETRERIEEAEHEGDLEEVKVENDERIAESEDRLEELFAADDLDAAKAETVKLRYWVNVRDTINNWEKGKPIVLQH
ncbi:Co-chaperone Hsc20 [Xylaria acuta]|nr:Co-chaperone Hsc20 [Xylaria acuta]